MKLTKSASGKTTLSLARSEWLKIGEKAGWNMRGPGEEYDPNMKRAVADEDAGKPKCAGCGAPADRLVDKSVQEWACQKCKQVNRLKGAAELSSPATKDEKPAEKAK